MENEIIKSTRHSKITGNFGESLICYWLSRRGFETALVDHTGIDVISKRPSADERLGISVKTRSKIKSNKIEPLNIKVSDIPKVRDACKAFGCEPYFAIIADQNGKINVFLIPLEELLILYPNPKKIIAFNLSDNQMKRYKENPRIEYFEFLKQEGNW